MDRTPEPELMDDAEQARAYAEADFEEPNSHFLALYAEKFSDAQGDVIDLGCGPGEITIRFAMRYPGSRVCGLDGADSMLGFGRRRLAEMPELQDRVSFVCGILPDATLSTERFDVLISNSLLHHLHNPSVLWTTIASHATPGASVLVMDLYRPESMDHATRIVEQYAGDESELLKTDFYNSLLAAFSPEEVRSQLDDAGLDVLSVEKVSDRHMLISGSL